MTAILLASGAVGGRGPRLYLALLPLLLLAAGFDVYCIVDLIRARSVRYLPKFFWVLVIICISFPAGPLLYLFLGRERNRGSRVPG